jgi:hypothetical protein
MFLWYPVMDLARAPRRTARKKGSGYENAGSIDKFIHLHDELAYSANRADTLKAHFHSGKFSAERKFCTI